MTNDQFPMTNDGGSAEGLKMAYEQKWLRRFPALFEALT